MSRNLFVNPLAARLALALIAPIAGTASAVTFTVGSDAACDFTRPQDAIDAMPDGDPPEGVAHEIRMSQGNYQELALKIVGKTLTLRGGYADCAGEAASGDTFLIGLRGEKDSVVTVNGHSDVTLERLNITGGDDQHGNGGGLQFYGRGDVTVRDVLVYANYAENGGGIAVNGVGGHAILWVAAGTQIEGNIAGDSGGGIRVEGDAQLVMTEDPVQIKSNRALGLDDDEYGNGGGLQILAPATADIGSAGKEDGLFLFNKARRGGGISIEGYKDNGKAIARFFSSNPASPPRIVNNSASIDGGGIFLLPGTRFWYDDPSTPYLCAHDVQIRGNRAHNGAGIFAQTVRQPSGGPLPPSKDYGGRVYLGTGADYNPDACATPGNVAAIPCAQGEFCASIDDNLVQEEDGSSSDGATILVHKAGVLRAQGLHMTGNLGGNAVRVFEHGTEGSGDTRPDLSTCLVANNYLSGPVMRTENDEPLLIDFCTVAGNTSGGDAVFSTDGDLWLSRSIVWQPGMQTLRGPLANADYVLASETDSIADNPTVFHADDPRFVDPANGNYRLLAASSAVDYAAVDAVFPRDLDGRERIVDLENVGNKLGPVDLGAYERQADAVVVRNPDFDRDLAFWTADVPGTATWDAADVSGGEGSGSVFVSTTPALAPGKDLIGPSQCILVPGPGKYRVTGHAMALGDPSHRDQPRLHWRYRSDSEDCAGPRTWAGEINLPARGTWAAPNPPGYAQITVTPEEWTSNATLQVFLVVKASTNSAGMTSTSAYFDGISFTPVPAAQ